MDKDKLYAVLTGDIVDSRKFERNWEYLLKVIKKSFNYIEKYFGKNMNYSFHLFEGDSFQNVISRPEEALPIAISLRASLKYFYTTNKQIDLPDARIAIGIGRINYLPLHKFETSSTGTGEAFHRSSPLLDEIKKRNQRLIINSPWEEIDSEFDVECALLDEIIKKWSCKNAEVILYKMINFTQEKMAKEIGISQPAVQGRLQNAGGNSVDKLCKRYRNLIVEKISTRTYSR